MNPGKAILTIALAALGAALMSAAANDAAAESETGAQRRGRAGVSKASFGKTEEGAPVDIYTLTNANGLRAKIMTYGATLTEMHVPDKDGKMGDVTLGFDNLDAYLKGHPFFGSTVGRYANRIAKGQFTLDGKTYQLAANNGPNHLHGGVMGFDKRIWKATPKTSPDGPAVQFTRTSHDGEEGYPGNVKVSVTYTLTNDNALRMEYEATTDKPTPINLTNHAYFNLAGKGDVLGHLAEFPSTQFTPVDDTLIPTGKIDPVAGSVMDFARPTAIGARIAQVGSGEPKGYDHNYIRPGGASFGLAARIIEPATGRVLEMWTDEPAFQFYTGNFLDGTLRGKGGVTYVKHGGFCLEAQHYPDSPNKPEFPSTILRPGETYRQRTEYRFSVRR